MTDRELMQQALYYMDDNCGAYTDDYRKIIEAIRARLSQCERCGEVNPAEIHTCTPKQPEPVAIVTSDFDGGNKSIKFLNDFAYMNLMQKTLLYTAPPQREWQGLTDEEINDHWITAMWNTEGTRLPIPEFARAIEAKLKEKNL